MTSQPADESTPHLNVSALLGELMSKCGVIWVDVPGDRPYPVWHVWDGEQAFVVNGPGEQLLPWLPPEVRIILRSRDSGARLLTIRAIVSVLEPESAAWTAATDLLAPERLNGDTGQVQRWADECTVTSLRPFGQPLEQPGAFEDTDGRADTVVTAATTSAHRPWHWKGRAKRVPR